MLLIPATELWSLARILVLVVEFLCRWPLVLTSSLVTNLQSGPVFVAEGIHLCQLPPELSCLRPWPHELSSLRCQPPEQLRLRHQNPGLFPKLLRPSALLRGHPPNLLHPLGPAPWSPFRPCPPFGFAPWLSPKSSLLGPCTTHGPTVILAHLLKRQWLDLYEIKCKL